MFKRNIFFVAALSLSLHAEPSAFELQSGATKNAISNLRDSSKNLQNIVTDLQSRMESVEQTQEGLKTLVEGQNAKIKSIADAFILLQNALNALQNRIELAEDKAKDQAQDIEMLKSQLLAQQEETKKLQASLQEINQVMMENNTSIIQQLTLMSQFLEKNNKPEANIVVGEKKEEAKEPEPALPAKSNKENFAEAKALLRKKDYNSAEIILNGLVKENYKVAESYFILGDIAYRKKDYKSAVGLYKKSATLDEKATYMPVLLWRTAWSFKYLKDDSNYDKFIDLLSRLYPESEQGKKALEIKEKSNQIKEENEQN